MSKGIQNFDQSNKNALGVDKHSARDVYKTVWQWERHAKTVLN